MAKVSGSYLTSSSLGIFSAAKLAFLNLNASFKSKYIVVCPNF